MRGKNCRCEDNDTHTGNHEEDGRLVDGDGDRGEDGEQYVRGGDVGGDFGEHRDRSADGGEEEDDGKDVEDLHRFAELFGEAALHETSRQCETSADQNDHSPVLIS
jgi:hypothetical protein